MGRHSCIHTFFDKHTLNLEFYSVLQLNILTLPSGGQTIQLSFLNDLGSDIFQVSVTAREDVPPFGPVLPDPPIFTEVRNDTGIDKLFSVISHNVTGTTKSSFFSD